MRRPAKSMSKSSRSKTITHLWPVCVQGEHLSEIDTHMQAHKQKPKKKLLVSNSVVCIENQCVFPLPHRESQSAFGKPEAADAWMAIRKSDEESYHEREALANCRN